MASFMGIMNTTWEMWVLPKILGIPVRWSRYNYSWSPRVNLHASLYSSTQCREPSCIRKYTLQVWVQKLLVSEKQIYLFIEVYYTGYMWWSCTEWVALAAVEFFRIQTWNKISLSMVSIQTGNTIRESSRDLGLAWHHTCNRQVA